MKFEHEVSRRRFLEIGSTTLAATGMASALSKTAAGQSQESVAKAEHDQSPSNPVPQNPALATANPDSVTPPVTDHGNVEPFKYPFSVSHKRVEEGGWARQVTVQDLPIATTLAGVNMRLTAGGIRELHWHSAAEWAFMLYGSARITAITPDGKSFVSDVREGDLWNFPSGIPHSIQGLAPDGCEFLLVFDDGAFSEYDTTLLTDWVAHTPREVLSKNFGVPQSAFDNSPRQELYIFQGEVPGPLAEDRRAAAGTAGVSLVSFDYHLRTQSPNKRTKSGEVRIVDSKNFPAATTIAAALVLVHPGGMREMHWHPNADEWLYYIKGKARMTVFAASARARTMDFDAGDVGYVQKTFAHYIENTGDSDLEFLEMFRSSYYQDVSLSNWLSHTPPELVEAHLRIDKATLDAIPKEEKVVVPA
jgi:oxalate decarboxylase